MGCRAASRQRHPLGIPPSQKGSEPALSQWGWEVAGGQQVYGSHTSALCNSLHTVLNTRELQGLQLWHFCERQKTPMTTEGYQLLRTRLLEFSSVRLQLSQVCQSAPTLLAPWGVALLLHPSLIGQTKIFSVIPETEIIPQLYRRSFD